MILPAENIAERTMAYSTFQRGTSPLSQRPQWGRRNSRLRLMFSSTESRVPGAGSFIRPGKKTDGERTFLESVKGKYASNAEYERVVLEDSGKEIEMIGFDKIEQQQRFSRLWFGRVMVVI